MTKEQIESNSLLPDGARLYRLKSLEPSGLMESGRFVFKWNGKQYPSPQNGWATTPQGMQRLADANRLQLSGTYLQFVMYYDDYPVSALTNPWNDTSWSGFGESKIYVVQTNTEIVRRCLLMTTDAGDLVFDPTCGSGTTAYVSEQWGRRWITCDTSRVPLALSRQRLLTATFPWYELKDEIRGPSSGFVYTRKQGKRGQEVGGIVPHLTLSSIANDEPPDEEVLLDKPDQDAAITRVTGAFCVEGTIPTPMDWEEQSANSVDAENISSFPDRMLEVLKRSPLLRLAGNKTVTLKNVRVTTRSLTLNAEAMVDATAESQTATLKDAVQEAEEKDGIALPLSQRPVAFVFGPENGAISTRLVEEAAKEANGKNYTHLYVIGFAIQPNARDSVENAELVFGVPATYIQATPDLMMGDLLKNMRSSQIFSVCGLPEIKVRKAKSAPAETSERFEVELVGLDVFDPTTMEANHRNGDDVPAWFLDTDYNGRCFHVSQAFFPRTNEWDKLKKALKDEFEDSVWEHLAGTVSAPFEAGEHREIAVKVIDDRGNELMVVRKLSEATR
jgi:adenine-specific DNA-methyltransferase